MGLRNLVRQCWPVLALLLWTASSSSLIVLNKRLMVNDGFAFPMALTAAGQAASFLGGMFHCPIGMCIKQYKGHCLVQCIPAPATVVAL